MRTSNSRRRTEAGSVIGNSWLGGLTYSTPRADPTRINPVEKFVMNCHPDGAYDVQLIWGTRHDNPT